MKRTITCCWFAFSIVAFVGCGGQEPIRIGAKSFAEQQILAEMASMLLQEAGIKTAPIVSCQDSFTAQRMLQIGQVDLMAEYSGTRWLFVHGPVRPTDDDLLETIRSQDAGIGLQWQESLGFDNSYCVLVTADRADALGLETIGDLAKLDSPVRIACNPEYDRRPVDGADALAVAYGFELGEIISDDNLSSRINALLNGEVDVAIGYTTDGVIDRLGLHILDDTEEFFPPYEAAFVVRQEVVESSPDVLEALHPLQKVLNEESMRKLNYAVDIAGRNPRAVARDFLIDSELISGRSQTEIATPTIVWAVSRDDDLGPLLVQAERAIADAFPDRELPREPKRVEKPVLELTQGASRLAILGAERFFKLRSGKLPTRINDLEAAAVVGTREVHLLRRKGDPSLDNPLNGQVGIPKPRSGAGIIAARLIEGRTPKLVGAIEELVDGVVSDQIDVAIFVATTDPIDNRVAEILSSKGDAVQLVPLKNWLTPERAVQNPFLRNSRIPKDAYGLEEPLETLGVQVVLAGASSKSRELAAGPGGALPEGGVPLTRAEVEALADSESTLNVAPDPALPSAWGVSEPEPTFSITEAIWLTVMNLVALAFIAWLISEIRRPGPLPEATLQAATATPTGSATPSE